MLTKPGTIAHQTNDDGTRNRRTFKRDLLREGVIWGSYSTKLKVRIVRVHQHEVVVEYASGTMETYLTRSFLGAWRPLPDETVL
ncbi:hypothetical protein SEA_MACGULLY_10 [Rhodococcus phage MacGully]|nr:hypothetical protein SEA_MACGULLY_10 [Rhodococcus phage MacGully]